MTHDEFKTIITNFKYYLKPDLFNVLIENADLFSDETKQEIVAKLQEAEGEMRELHEYQEKRNGIMESGVEKLKSIYVKIKANFQEAVGDERNIELEDANQLISNL